MCDELLASISEERYKMNEFSWFVTVVPPLLATGAR